MFGSDEVMTTVLLTGPIGSGKSEVAKYLRAKGIAVYDCDEAVKKLYISQPELKARIETATGYPFAELSRIFGDKDKLRILEEIVYPLLVEDILAWKELNGLSELLFIESAIALSKRQLDGLYDKVLMIDAPYSVRLERNPKTAQRDRLQSFEFKKIDTIIINDSSKEELYNKIDKYLWQQI